MQLAATETKIAAFVPEGLSNLDIAARLRLLRADPIGTRFRTSSKSGAGCLSVTWRTLCLAPVISAYNGGNRRRGIAGVAGRWPG